MSMDPILWAMKDAPVANVEEWAVLSAMAETADEDGCNAYNSTKTLADRMKLSRRTVQRRIDDMVERGLLALGDQNYWKLLRIPAHLRPTNYDLQIPLSWYGSADRVNAYRRDQGRSPLTHTMRPNLPPAPEKKRRADAKPATVTDLRVHAPQPGTADERGDYKSPHDSLTPRDSVTPRDSQSGGGVTTSHGRGRQAVTQPSPITHPNELTPAGVSAEAEELTLIPADASPAPKVPTFEDFYSAYPRHVGRAAAEKAWDVIVKKRTADLAAIVAGAHRYANDPNLPEAQFIPYPASWLNAGRWDDDPEPVRVSTNRGPERGPSTTTTESDGLWGRAKARRAAR